MKPIESIYIHFLDRYHGMRAQYGNHYSVTTIRQEANFAFRLALMFSNKVILPCSSLSESKLCWLTIKEFPHFNDYGVIGLSSPDGSIEEHLVRKKESYDEGSPLDLAKAYERMRAGEMPTFHKKRGSTTRQLARVWRETPESTDLHEFLRDGAPASALAQLERLWSDIPDLLEGRAFVPEHVNRIFEERQIPVRASASAEVIEPTYIGEYAAQFGSVVSSLRALNSPFEYGVLGQAKLSYQDLVQHLHRLQLGVGFENASSAALWNVYCSDEWNALAAIVFRGSRSSADMELARAVAGILADNTASARSSGIILVGDTYRAPPQAANEPPEVVETLLPPAEKDRQAMVERSEDGLFAAVLCAVEREFEALVRAIPPAGPVVGNEYVTTLATGRRVLVRRLHSMGNYQSAVAATELIQTKNPRNIVLAGIAGGFPSDDRRLGDVLIADQVVAYELEKLKGDAVELRPQAYRASFELVEAAEAVARRGSWKSRVSVKPPKPRPTGPNYHIGTTLSGEKVVAKTGFLEDFRAAWTKITGVEMEAAGAMTAVHLSSSQPRFIMVKVICDYADEAKADGWQPYAADVAAAFVAEMLISPEMGKGSGRSIIETPHVSALSKDDRYKFLQAMHDTWPKVATYFDIPDQDRETFKPGDQPQAIWNWLKSRGRLKELPLALMAVDRKDMLARWPHLVEHLANDDG